MKHKFVVKKIYVILNRLTITFDFTCREMIRKLGVFSILMRELE